VLKNVPRSFGAALRELDAPWLRRELTEVLTVFKNCKSTSRRKAQQQMRALPVLSAALLLCGRLAAAADGDSGAWALRAAALDAQVAAGNTLGGTGWYSAAESPATDEHGAKWAEYEVSHVPVVRQLNASTYVALCGHPQVWNAIGSALHAVMVILVRDESVAVVHFAELPPSVDRVAVRFSYRARAGGQSQLQAS
jgi:hypothetical protein